MGQLRHWHLSAAEPIMTHLAADVRRCRTQYADDQIWRVLPGVGDDPVVSLQTRYGGRVGLASLVLMLSHQGRSIYRAEDMHSQPVITAFAPGYMKISAGLTADLALTLEYLVVESSVIAGRFSIENSSAEPQTTQLDLFAHVGSKGGRSRLAVLTLADETHALSMGRFAALEPVVVLEGARAELVPGRKASPKVGVEVHAQPGQTAEVRWVHAGLPRMADSLTRAQFWLAQDWGALYADVVDSAQSIPIIETGQADFDAVIAFSYQQLAQSFMAESGQLPHPSIIANRHPDKGYSSRGDGTDYDRGWSGQSPDAAYLSALAVAPVAPDLAQGIIRNYLSVQAEDGSIDMRPGLGGQRLGMLCPPVLARLTWEIYQYTDDDVFLAEVFPGLVRFFNRWLESDLDADYDVLPEWQDERQTGYAFWPTFGARQPWAQNLNLHYTETPDMGAYLVSEARSLQQIAERLGDPGAFELQKRVTSLNKLLNGLWDESAQRFTYRDRDTHTNAAGQTLMTEQPAHEELILAQTLTPPQRLLIRLVGGAGRAPGGRLILQGSDSAGELLEESVDISAFNWGYGSGVYTSQNVFGTVDRVRFEGLSRVFRFDVFTPDFTREDVNGLLPLWSDGISAEQTEAIITYLTNAGRFWRESGLSIVPATDPNYDPSSANGGGGVWLYWTTLLADGLIAAGRVDLASELARRLLAVQVETLRENKHFHEFYHADDARGLGEAGYLTGIAPLHLLNRLFGVRIVGPDRVWTGGAFGWGEPVTVRQHGVMVERTAERIHIVFPSGHEETLPGDAEWQLVTDANGNAAAGNAGASSRVQPPESPPRTTSRVIIDVDLDAD